MSAASRGWALVTGAGGFLGRHLIAALLRRGTRVVALDLELEALDHHLAGDSELVVDTDRLRPLVGDVADPALRQHALAEVEIVFHLAAAHLGARLCPADFERVNVEASEALARDALAAGVRCFVHTSSVGVYGEIADPPADEGSPCHPDLPYERSKLEGERAIRRVIDDGLRAVILRPAWVYGPGCPRTAKLLRAIARGRFVIAGDGHKLRHCLYIDDMVRAFLCAAEAETALGQVVVVGDAQPVSIAELMDTIAEVVGAPRPRRLPYAVVWLAAVVCEMLCRPLAVEPPLARRTLKLFTNNTAFRIDRARQLLGFIPEHSLRAGLEASWRDLRRG